MFKYFILVPIFSLLGCCTSADDTTTYDKSESQKINKNNKDKDKKKNVNGVILKQDKLNALRNFLVNANNNRREVDPKNISLIIEYIDSANNMLNKIKQNRYDGNSLKIELKSLNNKIKQIEKSYKRLFNLPEQDNNNNNPLPNLKNNAKSITNLNWSKDTRNSSNVTINPLAVSDNTDPECIIVDLSKPPLDLKQVKEYYKYHGSYSPQENKVPEQGTLSVGKSSDEDICTSRIPSTN